MKNILITGGSGLIGRKITRFLETNEYQVAWLSRSPSQNDQKSFGWDIGNRSIDRDAIKWADGIIHLAGEGVAEERWTKKRKKEILESRTWSTRLLFDSISQEKVNRPKFFISASGINYYGSDTGDHWKEENAEPGKDFLSRVVVDWENEVMKISSLGVRTVILRTGIVLDRSGGALKEIMAPPIAAALGNGMQWMSWIHIDDLVRMYAYVIDNFSMKGVYNAVAPNPATNKELTKVAAKKAGKLFLEIGVPGFVLHLVLGELAKIVLGGIRVSSQKIKSTGFKFKYKSVDSALEKIYN